jgi:hypothetical protein
MNQKIPVADTDTEMRMHSRAMLLIKTDIVIVKVDLGATAKVPWYFCLLREYHEEGGLERRYLAPSVGKTPNPILILPTIALFLDACNIKKLLY